MDLFDVAYPARIAAEAARIEQCAYEVRVRAGRLAHGSAACPWDGAGARAFRSRAHEATARLGRAAVRLEDAATALRLHGLAVSDALVEREHGR